MEGIKIITQGSIFSLDKINNELTRLRKLDIHATYLIIGKDEWKELKCWTFTTSHMPGFTIPPHYEYSHDRFERLRRAKIFSLGGIVLRIIVKNRKNHFELR